MVFRSWHMKVCRKNASTYSWALVSLLTLCMLEPGCASLGPAGLEPAPSTDSGEHLALLVQGFFARLEGRNADAGGIDRLLAEYPLAFSLAVCPGIIAKEGTAAGSPGVMNSESGMFIIESTDTEPSRAA